MMSVRLISHSASLMKAAAVLLPSSCQRHRPVIEVDEPLLTVFSVRPGDWCPLCVGQLGIADYHCQLSILQEKEGLLHYTFCSLYFFLSGLWKWRCRLLQFIKFTHNWERKGSRWINFLIIFIRSGREVKRVRNLYLLSGAVVKTGLAWTAAAKMWHRS